MYASCLFCHAPLGRNETLEAFPVGRRLAYDAERGRLWVVCRRCERWNLTPLEERWEAIEGAERLYRETRLRAATDNVGLARVGDGLELVRIGRPLRPEFAAWRYGDQFGRRRRRQLAVAGAGVGAIGALVVGGAVAGVGIGGFIGVAGSAVQRLVRGSPGEVVARLPYLPGHPVHVERRMLADTRLLDEPGRGLVLEVGSHRGRWRFEGEDARRALALLVPAVNRYGGSAREVQAAVAEVEQAGSADAYLERLGRRAAATRADARETGSSWWGRDRIPQTGLFALRPADRLALEMAVHEEQERRALEGELAALERAWQDAEEIAAIADDLLVPGSVWDRLRSLGGRDG
ncbi:hypothetical protein [Roseisolibacter sp. H3M3-2]|uniref:hypothetical protein n=1 Tax=Roseisolibacter sp. H3M3-2 TaxID=3031323 RepID=UPI0023D9E665|nr:hypothetical protein [Roseisolibacter sp. H3M3-2]MDF1502673.1 hypothetical protein [Roseisolibacter sp. H3M3-2]